MIVHRRFLIVVGLLASSTMANAESLQEYAQKCDMAVGVTVPDFNCDLGTEVPAPHLHADGHCDFPNQLHKECDPGSRFQVLSDPNDKTAVVVAHCRKQNHSAGHYGDIAVIQHNRVNGATCFYQALGDLDGDVKAPSKGEQSFWMSPADIETVVPCGMCHDNGAIIRSPYLNQLASDPNALPGANHLSFNKNQPYYYVGSTFSSWKAYRVETKDAQGKDNLCISCHRMGVNNLRIDKGTARDFSRRAVAAFTSNANKNPDSSESPMWMPPEQDDYNKANEDEAKKIEACGNRFKVGAALPDELPNCRISQFSGPAEAPVLPLGGRLSGDPVVAATADGRIEIFVRGTDNALWHIAQLMPNGEWPISDTAVDRPDDKRPDASWSTWTSLGGQLTDDPAVSLNQDGRLEVFVRGTDKALWHAWQTSPGGAWSPWRSLGGQLSSKPGVGVNADGRLEVFARGTDNALWHTAQTSPNGGWSAWDSLAGQPAGDPVVGANSDGTLDVFVRGTDSALWHVRQTSPNGSWSAWASLGGELTGDAAVGSNADGRLEVFVRGKNHNALWHNWQTSPNGEWSNWHNLAGQVASNVAVGRNGDGALDVFVRGTDNGLWHLSQTSPNGEWSNWTALHGQLTSNVVVGRNASGRLEVFVRGGDSGLWHNWLMPGWN
jgi:hypothetical protein